MPAAALLAMPWTAHAQVAGSIGIDSDSRVRGYSISAGDPVGNATIDVDLSSGIYASAAASTVFADGNTRFLGWQADAGYAHTLGHGLSLDVGLQQLQYRAPYAGGRGLSYTEGYVGLVHQPFAVRVYYSPDYLSPGYSTIYTEGDLTLTPQRHLTVNAHIGALFHLNGAANTPTGYDWRVGLTRRIGPIDLHAAIAGVGPAQQYYYGVAHARTAATVGAAWNF